MEFPSFLERKEFAFLYRQVLGNELIDYLLAAFIFFIGLGFNRLLTRLASRLLFRFTKRYTAGVTEQELHDLLIQPLRALLYLVTIYLSFSVLRYPMSPLAVQGVEPWPKVALHHQQRKVDQPQQHPHDGGNHAQLKQIEQRHFGPGLDALHGQR
ncbi:MAG: hypothetical protein EOO56_15455 [Hymenobacter sp.]|nr:MAG: hypothetical protein EOO56_15455 [Hymenobacter sp.]